MVDARRQLAVRKGTGTAFAELNVRFGIKDTGLPKGLYVLCAPVHVVAPLKNNRPVAVSGKLQGCSKTGRARADDDRPLRQRFRTEEERLFPLFFLLTDMFVAAAAEEDFLFALHLDMECKDKKYIRLMPRVYGASGNGYFFNIVGRTPQFFRRQGRNGLFQGHGNTYIGQAYQFFSPLFGRFRFHFYRNRVGLNCAVAYGPGNAYAPFLVGAETCQVNGFERNGPNGVQFFPRAAYFHRIR